MLVEGLQGRREESGGRGRGERSEGKSAAVEGKGGVGA